MESLPADVLMEIALKMDAPELFKFCQSQKRSNRVICNNVIFWRKKLLKDFPNYSQVFPERLDSLKEEYKRIVQFHSRIENDIKNFLKFLGPMKKYLGKEYFTDFKNALIKIYLEVSAIKDEDERSDMIGEILRNLYEFFPVGRGGGYYEYLFDMIYILVNTFDPLPRKPRVYPNNDMLPTIRLPRIPSPDGMDLPPIVSSDSESDSESPRTPRSPRL
jgi:hypothetical protein